MAKFYLKDWHGKEKEFTDEKIFVRGEYGELIQFTQGEGDKPAVVQPLEVTESGTYTAPDGVDGYSPVTVNVQGGGGGSLPAGVYTETCPFGFASTQGATYFVYNGYLHAICKPNSSTSTYVIKRVENGAWVEVANGLTGALLDYYGVVEYKGKMHFIGGNSTKHFVWDGLTLEQIGSIPNEASSHCAFVIDGNLYIKTKSSGFYKWVEDTDTWESVAVTNCPKTAICPIFVHDRTIYIIEASTRYMVDWDSKICTTITDDLGYIGGTAVAQILGNYIYYERQGNLCRYSINDYTEEKVGALPQPPSEIYMCLYNGELYLCGSRTTTYWLNVKIHIVTE